MYMHFNNNNLFCLFSSEYGVDYFKQFNVVMNALDNRGEMVSSSIIICCLFLHSNIITLVKD